ncbi:MAG: DUF4097 family beta strand repeat-containing protein [Clostridia bacterium]|nr:DUF4097 family beta strand repeat-containing protein [Clostridia bacterium]
MTTFQKILKGLAIAFAIFLIVNICFGILSALGIVFGISDIYSNAKRVDIQKEFSINNINDIMISSNISDIQILKGDSLRVEATNVNENITLKSEGDKLVIKENDKNNFFQTNEKSEIKVYIPERLYIERFELDSGVGKTYIEYLKADKVSLDLGVGNIVIDMIESNQTKVNAGVGNIEINGGIMGDSDFDLGVGNTNISAVLQEKSKIECGVGDVDIHLLRVADGYQIDVEKGMGSIKLNGENIKENTKYGDGMNKVSIEAGMGNIDIDVKE